MDNKRFYIWANYTGPRSSRFGPIIDQYGSNNLVIMIGKLSYTSELILLDNIEDWKG